MYKIVLAVFGMVEDSTGMARPFPRPMGKENA